MEKLTSIAIVDSERNLYYLTYKFRLLLINSISMEKIITKNCYALN